MRRWLWSFSARAETKAVGGVVPVGEQQPGRHARLLLLSRRGPLGGTKTRRLVCVFGS